MGADYLGQTFYYSRTLTEELDNRIGYLELPMLMFNRTDAIIISLPPDYLGKTLTIAQSGPVM